MTLLEQGHCDLNNKQLLRLHCLSPDFSKMANNFITWTPGFLSNIVEEFHLQSTRFYYIKSYKMLHRPGEELSPSFHSVRKPMLRKRVREQVPPMCIT